MTLDDQVLEREDGVDALAPCRRCEVGETDVVEVVHRARRKRHPRVRRVHGEREQRRLGQVGKGDLRRDRMARVVEGETRRERVAVEALDRQLAQLRVRVELDAHGDAFDLRKGLRRQRGQGRR